VNLAILIFLVAAAGSARSERLPTPHDRARWEREIERARYRFVIGTTRDFDAVYPVSVFKERVRREITAETVLQRAFGLSVTLERLSREFDRIETSTKAPEQWVAVKAALGGDRRLIEEVFCRPLLVDRALRSRFAFDQQIHATAHEAARSARNAMLAGKIPSGTRTIVIARGADRPPSTAEMLEHARAEASLPRVLGQAYDREDHTRRPDPELARALEKELRRPGDVTTILEESSGFEVFRLVSSTVETWTIEAFSVPKEDFASWFERARRGW
jgi:hypothetical protein